MKKFITLSLLLWLLIPATYTNATSNTVDDSDCVEVSSPEEISDIFSDENDVSNNSAAESDSKYATKRIVLFGKLLESYDSAETIVTYPEYDETILEFGTEADTKTAYKNLLSIYGEENCFIDEVLDQEDLILEGESGDDDSLTTEDESTDSSYTALSWGVTDMGMAQLKSTCQDYFSRTSDYDKNVSVAVIDTGINSASSLFTGRTITGYNVMTSSSDYTDFLTSKDGHGTHVCGIIADGTPTFANLIVIGVFDESGGSSKLKLVTAFQYAIEHDADVINFSLGYQNNASSMTFLDNVIQTAYDAGIPIVTASGNGNIDVSGVYPALNSETLAISGVKKVNDTLEFDSSYSNYGDLIDFCAPGTNIVSANYASATSTSTKKGTSMSAPHITAALTWLKILYPNESVAELYQHLKTYCLDLGDEGKDIYYGNGYPRIGTLLEDRYGADFLTNNTSESSESTENDTNANDSSKSSGSSKSSDDLKSSATNNNTKSSGSSNTSKSSTSGNNSKSSTSYKPKKTRIIYAKRKCRRTIRLRWKKVKKASGYQICYSTSKTFRKGKHYVTIKGKSHTKYTLRRLKHHKKIYVRIRTYRVVNKKKYYSKWSNVKKVITL